MSVGGVDGDKGEWGIFTKSGLYHPPNSPQLWISSEIGSEKMSSLGHERVA
jgi:hypothetical protein